jgi:hypothetical protein
MIIAMPKPITQNGDNLHSAACFCSPILCEHFPDDMPKYVSGQTFKQAEKVKRKQGKQGELGI